MAIKQVAGFSFPFPPLFFGPWTTSSTSELSAVIDTPLSREQQRQREDVSRTSVTTSIVKSFPFYSPSLHQINSRCGGKTTLVFRFSFHFFSFVLLSERSARDEASRHADRRGQRNECNVETALPHAPPVREMHFFFHLFFFSAHLLPSRFNQLITDSKTWLPPSVNFRERCYPITAAQTKSSGFHWQWAVVNKSNLLSMKSLKAHVFIFFIFF